MQLELCAGQNIALRAGVLDDGQAAVVVVDIRTSVRAGSKAGVLILIRPMIIQFSFVFKGIGVVSNQMSKS